MNCLRPAGPPGPAADFSDERDAAARALYDERKNLLVGLMVPAAEPWEELPEGLKERWRRINELTATG
ncbi:hypothetical protein [Nesterenkonia sandarakina]|uniref:Uncharacterized protein n=1 Tax=Nesterenkonia sandarakina TaxID=272918 RepID=A0A2T0YCR8_9MICC|nr:hypothetical protein [Nesterenkonia sandarakina]PRZ12570.1 hypothetical protein BCL67_12014 [Nesterenkonia sandarakina]